eukprot:scaffold45494_cov48-Phaeocystis_antarctica.AAC.1
MACPVLVARRAPARKAAELTERSIIMCLGGVCRVSTRRRRRTFRKCPQMVMSRLRQRKANVLPRHDYY